MANDKNRRMSVIERERLENMRKQAARDAQRYYREREEKRRESEKSSSKATYDYIDFYEKRDEIGRGRGKSYAREEAPAEILRRRKTAIPTEQKKNAPKSHSKIERAANRRAVSYRENLSREDIYLINSERKIRNMAPSDHDDGYYVNEYRERQRQRRRAEKIGEQETEVIKRRKKPLTPKQVRRRKIILSAATCVVVLAAGIVLSLTVLFKTENIVVEGNEYYYDDQVIAFSNVSLEQNIFLACLYGTEDEIEDNLPYIEDAEISFIIPDTVRITVTDAAPSYVIKNDGSYLLISAKGRILERLAENTDNLPELVTDDLESTENGSYVKFTDSNVTEILAMINESLSENGIDGITGIDVKDAARIKLTYDGRITVVLGLPEDIDYKIRTAISIIDDKLDPEKTGTVSGTLDVSSCNTTKISRYSPDSVSSTENVSSAAAEKTD